jgi:glycerol-3-phosphate dehydrogenase
LFLYDFLGGTTSLPKSRGERLAGTPLGAGLKPGYSHGFAYFDARVDDARLTVLNARAAADLGAVIAPRMQFAGARVEAGTWVADLDDKAHGHRHAVRARAIVNAAGPWVSRVLANIEGSREEARVRHVKGSHIVVPRIHPGEHAYILQNPDKRIIFIIPYLERFSLIGTTDVPVEEFEAPAISEDETAYLCAMASSYCDRPITPADVVWSYSGLRPLYDDGAGAASAVTRDYVLKHSVVDGAALVNIFGGKLTTYRKLAEHTLEKLQAHFPAMGAGWTHAAPLPGGDFSGGLAVFAADLKAAYPFLPQDHLMGIARRHGTLALDWLDGCTTLADLGVHFGGGLYGREVDHMVDCEWAESADDVLFRRSKTGLMMSADERQRVADHLAKKTR